MNGFANRENLSSKRYTTTLCQTKMVTFRKVQRAEHTFSLRIREYEVRRLLVKSNTEAPNILLRMKMCSNPLLKYRETEGGLWL